MPHRVAVQRFQYATRVVTRWDPRANVMKIEGEPENTLRAGDPLVLDGVFPIAWERERAQV
jgi:hypothetical protein